MSIRMSSTSALCLGMVLMASTFSAALDPQKPLADIHKEAGLGCKDCHGTGAKKLVPMEKCLTCHESYVKVAERTKELYPNPHDNHMIDLKCTKCHQGHNAQVNYCQTCHVDMTFKPMALTIHQSPSTPAK